MVWGNWSFLANLAAREKHVPVVPWFATLFADRGTKLKDGHDFAEARYSRDLGAANRIQFRLYYDRYVSDGRYDTGTETGIEAERDFAQGQWVGSQVTFRRQWHRFGALTLGTELIAETQNLQRADVVSPEFHNILTIEEPDLRGSIFAQHEVDLSSRWKAVLGLRYDHSRLFGGDLSPRAALLFQQSPRTVYKLLWGRAFRNPSVYEAFYDDGGLSQESNPGLRPEHAGTWEASWERLVGRRINVVATAYRYDLQGMIQGVPLDAADIYQYRNVSASRTYGTEVEVYGHLSDRVEGGASLAVQRAEDVSAGQVLPNAPGRIAKLRLAVPLWRRKVYLGTAWQYLSSRNTLAGHRLPGVPVGDLNISTFRLNPSFDVQGNPFRRPG